MRTPIRKPTLPLHAGRGAMFPRLYNPHGIALDPAEVEWVARVVNSVPDVAKLRRALRDAIDELEAGMGGPRDMDENELGLLLRLYGALGPAELAKFKREWDKRRKKP